MLIRNIFLFIEYFIILILPCLGWQSNITLSRQKRQYNSCRLKFLCETNDDCIHFTKVCNGVEDCLDGSDERPEICLSQTQPPADSCSIPVIKNGRFKVQGDTYNPGSPIPNYSLLNIICHSGYSLHPATPVIGCIDGVWSSPLPKCIHRCPPRPSGNTFRVGCIAHDKSVNCNEPMEEGTVAIAVCKNFHTYHNSHSISVCTNNIWDTPPPRCVPQSECGEALIEAQPLTRDENYIEKSRFPWHVGIYHSIDGGYRYLCGGSIISPSIVITAAHCLVSHSNEKRSAEQYYIAAGKYLSDYDTKKDPFAQKRQVKEIYIHPHFAGANNYFVGDFAVVVTKNAFQITNAVQPVCVDWSNNNTEILQPNTRGSVTGWQYDDPILKISAAPYIDREECLNQVNNGFKGFITHDKFCVDSRNTSAVCMGFSGGGIYFKQNNKYFIRGVLSVADSPNNLDEPCNHPYGLYTNISKYLDLIQQAKTNNPEKEISSLCPPRVLSSAIINCTLNGEAVDCNEPLEEGTVAITKCKEYFTSVQGKQIISTCTNGAWDKAQIQCEPECGEIVPDGDILITDGQKAKRGKFPWAVGVYRLREKKFEYQCGGVIISPSIVLSVAHCFTYFNGTKYRPREFYIGAGKYYNAYNSKEDKLAQYRQVKTIEIPPSFNTHNYKGDLAVVVVDRPFEMSNVVRPVCVDWLNKQEFNLSSHNIGTIVGWGFDSTGKIPPELAQLSAPPVDHVTCLKSHPNFFSKLLTSDKFCAGFRNGSGLCKGDSGNGLIFESSEDRKYYLQGIASVGKSNNNGSGGCDNFHFNIYTRISSHIDFIKAVVEQNGDGDRTCEPRVSSSVNVKCTLYGVPIDCSGRVIEGAIAISQCKKDFVSITVTTSIARCSNGRWDKPLIYCQRVVKINECPALVSDSVNVKCILDDKPVNCNRPMTDGTVAISECKDYYTPFAGEVPISIARCVKGIWNNPLIRCQRLQPIKIECGEVSPDGETHAINAKKAKRGEFPWHVGLYRQIEIRFDIKCGGSIITPKIILTAAHCFTDEYGERYPAEQFFIGAGKYYSDYNSQEDKRAQKRQVKEYHIPPTYRGYETNFAGDLAVAIVEQSFELTNLIQPVCLEWENKIESQQLRPNNRGNVAGWGAVDPHDVTKASPELKQLSAPYIDVEQCLDNVPKNFRRWVTTDKFCAGFTNGSSVCKGDSGGGMVFEWVVNNTQKFYIRGIVSVGPSNKKKALICDNFKYGAYTKVSFYNTFILKIINQIQGLVRNT